MSVAKVYSRGQFGIDAPPIIIEVDLTYGLPGFSIVGLPETAVKESKDRVRSALINSKLEFPTRRITVNLAPADLPKQGSRFDLPIAIGILVACGHLAPSKIERYEFLGELSLTGELRAIPSVFAAAYQCEQNKHALIIPTDNADEVGYFEKLQVYGASSLLEVLAHLLGEQPLSLIPMQSLQRAEPNIGFSDVYGQESTKRALQIAAAGRHNILLCGPPGSGKTMLAKRFSGLLPQLNQQNALESALVWSSSIGFKASQWCQPCVRAPHHSASAAAIIGGGHHPSPGDISLAHQGVLLMDEIVEYNRQVLEQLREPLESHEITISRANWKLTMPADIQLVATMNPCPCGYYGSTQKLCRCTPEQVMRYQLRLSGPLRDRIDIIMGVEPVDVEKLLNQSLIADDQTPRMREGVSKAQSVQFNRQETLNARLSNQQIKQHCIINQPTKELMRKASEQLKLSSRAFQRIIKIARTIADLDNKDDIELEHMAEAISLRRENYFRAS